MNKILIYIIGLFVIICDLNAEGWTFEADSENYPAINSIFNIRDKWQFGDIGFYKGYTVIPLSRQGFALYKDKEWTFYTPELIRANLINKSASDSTDMDNITILKSQSDYDGNLWLMANNAIYRYNNSGTYCYYSFKTKNNHYINPTLVSGLHFNGANLYCRVGYIENSSNGYKTISKFFKYDRDNNEFVEQFDDDSHIPFIRTFEGLIDPTEHIITHSSFKFVDSDNLVSKSNKFYRIQDTIYRLDSADLIKKFWINSFSGDLNLVGYDSTLWKIEQERISKITSNAYSFISSNFTQTDKNDNIYILTYYTHSGPTYYCDTCEYAQPRIIKYERNGKVSFTSIPLLPGDTETAYPDDFILDESGRMAILYRGRGIMHFTPDGAGVEDYPIPGAWIWNLYPNPAKETARMEFHLSPNVRNEAKITISDINGAVIKDITSLIEYDQNRQEATIDFSVSDLSSGNYYILISAGNSKKLRRLVVNK